MCPWHMERKWLYLSPLHPTASALPFPTPLDEPSNTFNRISVLRNNTSEVLQSNSDPLNDPLSETMSAITAIVAANSASTYDDEGYTSNAAIDALPPGIFSLLAGVWTYLLPGFTALGRRRSPTGSLEHYEVPGFLMFFGGGCGVLYAPWQAVEARSYGQQVVIASKAFLTISLLVALPWTAIVAALAVGSLVSRCAGYRPVGQSERVSQKGEEGGFWEEVKEQWKGMRAIFESEGKPMVSSEAAQPVLGHHSTPSPGDPGWAV
ncbi:hypothetical protein B0A48_05827 [Cryoendolithus antarcticus]|uniref:Uncharacterized protein n=1 Tax=Cryoendolithus antarcticus TaxID=1507870 RepID=A0A1V8TC25_9PEZI|nr:hypothetical protein B0A48_05827 [Cryoendolithus antarcticus]